MSFSRADSSLDFYFERQGFVRELDIAHTKAAENLSAEIIKENDFIDLYSPETVAADLSYVTGMEKKFVESQTDARNIEAKKMGTVFEAIMHEQIELNDWLGEGVSTRKASKFDDIKNGVDSVAEIEHETSTSHLALAFDITYGSDLLKKIDRIKREIDTGALTEVKYFESSDQTFKGKLSKVPRVVVGADSETMKSLMKLWTERKQKELAVHFIQLQIIDEIIIQLETYKEYARKSGKEGISNIFDKQLTVIKNIQLSKKGLYSIANPQGTYRANDKMFKSLVSNLEGLFNTSIKL